MGKNSVIDEMGNLIGNTVVHRILAEKTNRPESLNFLGAEEVEYRAQARRKSKEYNWNESDILQIKEKALKKIRSKFEGRYTDVSVSKEEMEITLDEEMNKLLAE